MTKAIVKRLKLRGMISDRKLELTAVFIKDPKSHKITAFFSQLPNIITHGKNISEATTNLWKTVQDVFSIQNEDFESKKPEIKKKFHGEVKTRTFALSCA
jgi:predicted RNase H-like HicB family nuclease